MNHYLVNVFRFYDKSFEKFPSTETVRLSLVESYTYGFDHVTRDGPKWVDIVLDDIRVYLADDCKYEVTRQFSNGDLVCDCPDRCT